MAAAVLRVCWMIATLASGFTAACSQSGSGTGAADASPDRGSEASLGFVWAEVRPVRLDAPKPGCGDGILAPGEDCDDGNFVSGDGCSPLCAVEFGWYCPSPGRPCVSAHACGNAFLSPDEACDDGNTVGGDGCSDDCREVEPGWRCPAVGRPCLCEPDGGLCTGGDAMVGATCGNGIVEPGEACDDGSDPNRTPHNQDDAYGGCTTRCSYGGFCGDGVVNGAEACDEGSRNVELYGEPGCSFLCTQAGYCGDGIVQDRGVEDCDMGPANGDWRSPCDLQCRFILLEM